ncbi:MAG: hypothetical protein U0872_09775 [Planctomycetaceae bacterium]
MMLLGEFLGGFLPVCLDFIDGIAGESSEFSRMRGQDAFGLTRFRVKISGR